MRQVASELISNSGDRWRVLASAAYLGVATGDPQLRRQAEALIDKSPEFMRRGIDAQYQQWTSDRLREALANFPNARLA